MSTALLSVQDLHVNYGPVRAVRGISFDVAAGETVAIIGANGAGKTTIMRALSSVIPIASGQARFADLDIRRTPTHALAKAGLLHVPEGRATLASMSVEENLRMAWEIRPASLSLIDAFSVVWSRFPRLQERAQQSAGNLSGGEQQMLAISRALVNPPQLLLVDEPSLGLSPLFSKEVFRLLSQLRYAGMTMLLVEQNVRSALALASRAYVLEHGVFSAAGNSADFARDPVIIDSYLGRSDHSRVPAV